MKRKAIEIEKQRKNLELKKKEIENSLHLLQMEEELHKAELEAKENGSTCDIVHLQSETFSLASREESVNEQEHRGNSASLESNAAERIPLRSFPESAKKSQVRRHRRSRSDDLFKRKLRYNDEQDIKLSEKDAPSNFITSTIPEDEVQERFNKNKMGRRVMHTADTISLLRNDRNIEVNDMREKKYTTRTSSAGTLIIPEESFRNAHRRRQRRDAADVNDASGRSTSNGVKGHATIVERKSSARSTYR
nr:uncharacterized protein LOC111510081 [Leptinotarsa decemlineata]